MVELEIDGKKVEVPPGSMVMHAASKLDIFVPHFCYHKKLSIAANCRMCLVEVEKAPKPLPACATPVTPGMKVWTASERAVKAQKGVMEFLLINHPLDCPICDQGGECQLQDLAVGYGGTESRYDEPKRVVFHKPLGPLISAEEMSRCIHCTRCVRFGQEVAGQMELGMAGRGEHSEIMSFVGRTIDSELSGNMIDICPVGALTSRPFRYSARTWELSRRKSVAPHDSLGSNIVVQVKADRVMRVVPLENEAVNECWISDRDRFSYEGLYADDRLRTPMIKQDGRWAEVDWPTALQYAAHALGHLRDARGGDALGALASPNATLEELALLGRLMRGLGSDNVDFRLRQTDFSAGAVTSGAPWLGMSIDAVSGLDRVLLVGSFVRKDHPLFASRLRAVARRGAQVSVLHAVDDDLLMPLTARAILPPSAWSGALGGILAAILRAKGEALPASLQGLSTDAVSEAIATSLMSGESRAVLLGNAAVQAADFSTIASLAQAIANATGAVFGFTGEGANAVGGHLAGALPQSGGRDARAMVERACAGYLLLGIEPGVDHALPVAAAAALAQAESVIALTAFKSPELLELADCLLPVAPFTETSGTFVNCEGRAQSFNGVVRPLGDARPAWKVLRVLANHLDLAGFDFDSSEAIRDAVLAGGVAGRLNNQLALDLDRLSVVSGAGDVIERIADVPLYFSDAIVRRASSLQKTADARAPRVRANARTLARIGIEDGATVRVSMGASAVDLQLTRDERVADGAVRIAAAHSSTAGLAAMTGPVTIARV